MRELPAGITLGVILGVIGLGRIELWQYLHDHSVRVFGVPLGMNYNQHSGTPFEVHLIALTVGLALIGVVTFGTMVGSMLPFLFRRIGSVRGDARGRHGARDLLHRRSGRAARRHSVTAR